MLVLHYVARGVERRRAAHCIVQPVVALPASLVHPLKLRVKSNVAAADLARVLGELLLNAQQQQKKTKPILLPMV